MIDAIIKITEKMQSILERKQVKQEKIFDSLIEPLYKDMKIIHQNYLELFEWCNHELSEKTGLNKILEVFSKDRLVQEHIRRSVFQVSHVFVNDTKLEGYEKYFGNIREYFLACDPRYGVGTLSTVFEDILIRYSNGYQDEWNSKDRKRIKDCLCRVIRRCLEHIRKCWKKISIEYAKIMSNVIAG